MGSQSGLVSFFVVTFGVSRAADSRNRVHGGVLERLQGRIELERLSKLLHTRRIGVEVIVVVVITANGVVLQAAMQVEKRALSAAADSSIRDAGWHT